jgi:hypothetical protein
MAGKNNRPRVLPAAANIRRSVCGEAGFGFARLSCMRNFLYS